MSKLINVIASTCVVACSSPNGSAVVDAPSAHSVDAAADATHLVDASGSGSGSGSATNYAFACAGNTMPPMTIASTVAVTGTAGSLNTDLTSVLAMQFITPYAGAVDLCNDEPCASANLLGSAAANAGAFSFSLATSNAPVPGYVEIPAAGSGSATTLPTLAYVGTPYVKDAAVPFIVLAPQAAIAAIAQNAAAECTTGSGDGFIAYKAVDCNGTVITDSANVHGALTQNAAPVGDPPIDIYSAITTALASAGFSQFDSYAAPLQGIFISCGVPAGATTLTVTYSGSGSGVDFLPVTVLSVGSAATEVAAQPGY